MGWDVPYDPNPWQPPEDPREEWKLVYPVFLRKRLLNSEVKYDESLMYIASTEEKALEWCQRNLDTERKDDPDHCWWFAICQEAIDGEFSGVKGLVDLLDWDGKHIFTQPLDGYQQKENEDGDEVDETSGAGDADSSGGTPTDGNPGSEGSVDSTEERPEEVPAAV